MEKNPVLSPENIAPGVRIGRDESTGIERIGSDTALVSAGFAEAEWFVGLGGLRRHIARLPDGGFVVVGEGRGNRMTNQHKECGAYSIGRNRDGSFSVFAYRHPDEYRERKVVDRAAWLARNEAWRAEQAEKEQRRAWLLAKDARAEGDFPSRWKNGVLHHLEQVEMLISGRMVFTDFPDVGLQACDIEAAGTAAACLRRLIESSRPRIKDRVQMSNVISLNVYAYRNMKRS